MDRLYQRYAYPFSFIDGMILTMRFEEFVTEFVSIVGKEKEEKADWEFFLHKVWDGSYKEFKDSIETNKNNQNMSKRTIETTVKESMNILKNFKPDKGGER
jgi:hypothetical protein